MELLNSISDWLISVSDAVCNYPEFVLLIGGGLYLFIYSKGVSVRLFPEALRALRQSRASRQGKSSGQISSVQALLSAIAATVGMGNIAGVAIALTIGGPGVIFWMWVSAIVGMSTKFFEGSLAVMYKGVDSEGQPQGGPMYMIDKGLGKRWHPMAVAFAVFGLVGTLSLMQANQLVEAATTVFTTPAGVANTATLRAVMGLVIAVIVGIVVLGGIKRIASWASRIVPLMVALYFMLVGTIVVLNIGRLPDVLLGILRDAFNWDAGLGALAGIAVIGARRAAFVNEAGIGTASMMHGASRNTDARREGLVAMLGPMIDSGIVCTLTAIPILLAGSYAGVTDVKGLYVALNSYAELLPGYGQYLLMAIVFFFAFSTMFSYSYYGQKCTNYLFGANRVKYYNYYYLAMLVVGAVIPLGTMVAVMDLAFFLMAMCTMTTLILLAPRVKQLTRFKA